jgi:predicted nucleic acid-binding protein
MPFVLVDTSVTLPATLSPRGLARKFFVLLAYGAISYEVEHGRLELDELSKEAEATGGKVRGLEQAEQHRILAGDRLAALEELLPHGAPDDWVAVGSAVLFDEYERKLREIGDKLNPNLREEDIPKLRHQVEAVCAIGAPPFDPAQVPALTRDPQDDPIVYAALVSDADLLISDDKHIVPDGIEHQYEHEGRTVLAITFNELIESRLSHAGIDFDEIDGSWLGVAHAAMGVSSPQAGSD